MKFLVILLSTIGFNSAFAIKPNCMDQDFVGAFAQVQRCWLGNDAFSCGFPYLMGGLAGGMIGPLVLEGAYNSRARKLPLSLDEKQLEDYFKKVPHGQNIQTEIDQIRSDLPKATAETKPLLKQRLDWLEWKKKILTIEIASEELTDETTKSLKKKGYKVDEIDKVRGALVDYQRELREYQNKIDEAEALDHHEKQRLQRQVALAEDGLKAQPDNKKAQKRAKEARENLNTFEHATIPLVQVHKMTEGVALIKARVKITALRKQMSVVTEGGAR